MARDHERTAERGSWPGRRSLGPLVTATLAVCAALAVAAVAAGPAGVAAADGDGAEPTVVVTDATADPGENATVEVVLTAAPDGLAGYELRLALADGDARVLDAGYPERFGLTSDPEVDPDGRTVWLEAADLGDRIGPGAENVTLATVTVASEGDVAVTVADLRVDADGGARVSPATDAGRLTVGNEARSTGTPSATATARAAGSGDGTATATTRTRGRNSPGFGARGAVAALVLVVGVLVTRRR